MHTKSGVLIGSKIKTLSSIMEMIEVFRTNVNDRAQANMIVDRIHEQYSFYKANFDLQDCDRIVRIKSSTGQIHSPSLISILNDFGFQGEVLPDIISFYNKAV